MIMNPLDISLNPVDLITSDVVTCRMVAFNPYKKFLVKFISS